METLRVGDPLDKSTDMGAIVDPRQRAQIEALVAQGISQGARVWQPEESGIPGSGCFYPPTLCTEVEPANILAQEEIFGPVVVLMPFRTPEEAIALANHTRYGLAASVWTENVNLALAVAPRLEAGTVWINCTNLFDAASGFGGVRESGFGREGGREGLISYLRPRQFNPQEQTAVEGAEALHTPRTRIERGPLSVAAKADGGAPIDRSPKLYIGGRQVRPDGGGSLSVVRTSHDTAEGVATVALAGVVGEGNRKDLRNAVEAARKAQPGWASASAHLRSQILFYLAENLGTRTESFISLLHEGAGLPLPASEREVQLAMDRLVFWAGWADKVDGQVHATPYRNVTLAMVEPVGVLGILAPETYPLLGLVSAMAPAMAFGNAAVIVPSSIFPLAATLWTQVLETSDVPGGVVNLITGQREILAPVLADHDDVDGIWTFGASSEVTDVERRSAGNLKRVWAPRQWPWLEQHRWMTEVAIEQATRVKNIWVPYGV
jgi:aldehyde dehydrogenase (NAD+)